MLLPFLSAIDFMNFTYRTNPCSGNVPVPVVMRAGQFSYFDRTMAADFDLRVVSVKNGSLQKGTRQAAVVISCDFPVGGTAAAYLFDERKNGAVLLGRIGESDWGADWGLGPDSIRIRFAGNVLHVQSCGNNACSTIVKRSYTLIDGKLETLAH